MRECPFNNCGKRIPDEMFACPLHWHTLTRAQKRTVWDACDDYRADKIGVEELRAIQQAVLDEAQPRRLF